MTGTTTITPPAVLEDERRATAACNRRRMAELLLRVWREAECQAQLASVSPYYHVPRWIWTEPHLAGWDEIPDAEKRRRAIAWLRLHMAGLKEIAARLGVPGTIDKISDGASYGIRLTVRHDVDPSITVTLEATVPSDTTCEYVPTGEVEVIEARPAETRPVLKRVCPPSLLAGVEDDVVPPLPPGTKVCIHCGVHVQSMRALGWASTSTGGLACGDGQHEVDEQPTTPALPEVEEPF